MASYYRLFIAILCDVVRSPNELKKKKHAIWQEAIMSGKPWHSQGCIDNIAILV